MIGCGLWVMLLGTWHFRHFSLGLGRQYPCDPGDREGGDVQRQLLPEATRPTGEQTRGKYLAAPRDVAEIGIGLCLAVRLSNRE